MIVSNVKIVFVTEFLVTESQREDKTCLDRDHRSASDVRIVSETIKIVFPHNRSDRLTKISVTDTTIIWKLGFRKRMKTYQLQ